MHISGGGFSVGSYRCECKEGYYFQETSTNGHRYFNGSVIENDLSKNNGSEFNKPDSFKCIKCRGGCTECIDGSPCIFEHSEEIRFSILGLSLFCFLVVMVLCGFVWRYRDMMVRGLISYSSIAMILSMISDQWFNYHDKIIDRPIIYIVWLGVS